MKKASKTIIITMREKIEEGPNVFKDFSIGIFQIVEAININIKDERG